MSKRLNVGVIGTGFMGRAHSNAYRKVGNFFPMDIKPTLKTICALEPADKLQAFADQWGYESYETDWRKLMERDDIDQIDVCTPNNTHKEIVLAAAAAGKSIICEKPLAMNVAEAEEMCQAVEKAGVPNLVSFNYRRVPAITLAKQLVDEDRVGQPFHYRATYLQDWTISTDVPQGGDTLWRLDAKVAGSGVTGDLLAHSIDTAEWLNGPIQSVVAKTETFVKQRMHQDTGKVESVGIDDACMFLAVFANGSMGTFESTRYARGRKNYNTFEINGQNGSVFFDLEDPQYLDYFRYATPKTGEKIEDHVTGWQRIHVTNFEHPYMDKWWVPGCTVGYEHTFVHQLADYLAGLQSGQPAQPDFRSGLRTQKVCDAILESAKTGQWTTID
ncbi:Gfo/Idh/MocA family protein [Thioalkalivibrio sp.]|uniref:Gfo/Idh/MocA family protein n=1 Tax=Thioalkalivibrio sp. TaxID=2093813 RepID=UPI0039765969